MSISRSLSTITSEAALKAVQGAVAHGRSRGVVVKPDDHADKSIYVMSLDHRV